MPHTRSSSRTVKPNHAGISKRAPPKRAPRQIPGPHRKLKTKAAPATSNAKTEVAVQPEIRQAQPEEAVEGTEKVARVYNELWESTPVSLAFIDHGLLETDADTEIISLNLIDHIIKEENWNPALSMNKLSAACFLFASRVTGKKNAAADIALSFDRDAEKYASALLATINQSRMATDYTVRIRIAQALKMNAEDIEYGYGILWEQRSELRELVGQYASDMDWLPMPEGVSRDNGSSQAAVAEDAQPQAEEVKQDEAEEAKAEELMKAADAPLVSPAFLELDEFECAVAENEPQQLPCAYEVHWYGTDKDIIGIPVVQSRFQETSHTFEHSPLTMPAPQYNNNYGAGYGQSNPYDNYSQAPPAYGSNVEMQPLTHNGAPHSSATPEPRDPNQILNDCRAVGRAIDDLESRLQELQRLQRSFVSGTGASNKDVDALSVDIMSGYRGLADRVKRIKAQPDASAPRNKAQVEALDRRIRKAINQYQQIESQFRKEVQEQQRRQYLIVRPDASESEIREATEGGGDTQIFQQALLNADRRGQAQSTLRNVQQRHDAIQQIERTMIELQQLFQDLDAIVVQQEAAVVDIEQKAEETHTHLEAGNVHVDKAISSARAARKKKWICLGICIAIFLIIVIIILIYGATAGGWFKNDNKNHNNGGNAN
ncbi:hypothetical protein AC578_7974 [Pseudocercospora eumusae]|uniref:t-SNARE coiled-coil homology domain-containing protein n=1 Tax=Pseudocercospora eumusae TaxID=321146 RepID=A0A139HPA5_9PEZI|nr:hypothetical protein AC578_7974 [Pseudocercospora eumusae]